MLLPSIFGEDLFDDLMDDMFLREGPKGFKMPHDIMRTDIKELENNYELDVELPGVKKENIALNLKNGYLTISVKQVEEEKKWKFVRRERYVGQMYRSYFIGEGLREEDIKAKFEDGVLVILLPKEAPKRLEETKLIAIE